MQASDGSYTWTIPEGVDSSECLVRISDAVNSAVSDRSNNIFTISPAPWIDIISPNGGEKWAQGSVQSIRWASGKVEKVKIIFSFDDGATWGEIGSDVDASGGSYSWTVPGKISTISTISTRCKIRVISTADCGILDQGEGVFSIISNIFITVTSPSFGDRWTAASKKDIIWEFSGLTNVKIELSLDDGSTWQDIVTSTSAATGTYNWDIPDTNSTQCIIRISNTADTDIFDLSDRFEIIQPELKITHLPITEAQENEGITFSANVTGTAEIKSVLIHYDVTGSRNFLSQTPIPMNSTSGDNYSGTLGMGYFTALGIEYYIIAKDINNKKTRAPADVGFYAIKARVSDIRSTQQLTGGSEQNSYRMVSVPLNLEKTTIVDQLNGRLPNGNIGTDWRLFRYPEGSATPQEYPDIDEGFSPGKAFWLITREDFTLEAPEGTTVTTSEPFNITLKPGWNDIANPWMFDIFWDDVENPSSALLSSLYTYEREWSDPTNPPLELEPWEGYAVKNLENRNVIIRLRPVPASGTDKPVLKMDTELWKLSIKASAGDAMDSANHLGVRTDAQVEWDKYDHVEPPPVGEYVSVNFPHRDWLQYPYDYTVDFRPPADTISWDFNVKTNIFNETVEIEFVGVEHLPEELNVKAVDLDSSRRIALDDNKFDFVSENGLTERHFRLVVSNSLEPEPERNDPSPERFVVVKCYPNPFNPQTTIRYELSIAGKVKISVFNSLGQRVRDYEPGYKDSGVHELVFDATGLTSGLYIYNVDAGYASINGKMLYMK